MSFVTAKPSKKIKWTLTAKRNYAIKCYNLFEVILCNMKYRKYKMLSMFYQQQDFYSMRTKPL